MTRNRLLAVAAGVGVVASALLIAHRAVKLSDLYSFPGTFGPARGHLGYDTVVAWFYLAGSVALAV